MINEILLYAYDDTNDKIFSDNAYAKELEWSRKKTILAYLKEQEIYSGITVSESEMREAFLRVNETISARHLYAASEEEANELYELVKNGVDFNLLAKQVFTDSVLKNNGGYIGYFTWGDMDPAFEDAAYSLKVGEISSPVKTAQGYSIIKLESRVQKPLLTEYEFRNKKSHLESVLKIRKKLPAEKEYINKILDHSRLSFNENSLKNILTDLYRNDQVESGTEKNINQECLSYNGKNFSVGEIEKQISDLPVDHKKRIISIETLKAAIEGLLIRDILYNIAVTKGYDSAEPVISMIEGYRKNIFLKYKIDEITKNSFIPDSALHEYYNRNIHTFSKERELNLQEIIVDNQNLADSLIKLISGGYDFGNLAKEFSIRKWSAENNGIMGSAPISKFGSLKEMFWDAKIGETLGPVKIENLFGIFRVIGKSDSEPIDYDLVKDEVLKAAQFERQTETVKSYVEKLKEKISVRINNDLLGSYNILG
jgi:parvulin-like peptidyl-prolyl isomerase